jgi:thiol-disulfide isomerase/thioredoxin
MTDPAANGPDSNGMTDAESGTVEKLIDRTAAASRTVDQALTGADIAPEALAEVRRLDADLAALAPREPRLALARLCLMAYYLPDDDETHPSTAHATDGDGEAPESDANPSTHDVEADDPDRMLEDLAEAVDALDPEHADWTRWLQLMPDPDAFDVLRRQLTQVADRHTDPPTARCAQLLTDVLDLIDRAHGADPEAGLPDDTEVGRIQHRIDEELSGSFEHAADRLRSSVATAETILEASRFLEPGRPAPPFDLPLLGGGRTNLARYADRHLLVEFTASWCGPCHQLMPDIVALNQRWGVDVAFLGVAISDTEEDLRSYLSTYGVTWEFALMSDEEAERVPYGAAGIPHLLLIGPDGSIVEPSMQRATPEEMSAIIEAALSGEARPQTQELPSRKEEHAIRRGTGRVRVATHSAYRHGDDLHVEVLVDIEAGWYVHSSDSPDGIGLDVTSEADTTSFSIRDQSGPKLSGRFVVDVSVADPGPDWEFEVVTQACSTDACERPERTRLAGLVPDAANSPGHPG